MVATPGRKLKTIPLALEKPALPSRLLSADSWQAFHKVTALSPPRTLFGGMKTVLGRVETTSVQAVLSDVITSLRGGRRKDGRIEERYRKSRRMTESNSAPLPFARRSGALQA
jgi:hypothetical protein